MQFAICYVSTSTSSMPNSEIEELLRDSSRKNNNIKISGLLLYSGGNFFQVLEGKKEVVLSIFEKIKLDERHYDIIQLFRKDIEQPRFKDYESDFVSVHSAYHRKDVELYTTQIDKLNPSIQNSVRYILQNFSG